MRVSKPRLLVAVALSLAASMLACQWPELPTAPGGVLFQDDFSRSLSGWSRYQDADYFADYVNGTYQMEVRLPNADVLAHPGLSLGDVRIHVDAAKLAGPDDNAYGVVCRFQDMSNFYFLIVSSDGYAGIGISKDGRRTLLSADALMPREAVLKGGTPNHLEVTCIGDELRLLANGVLIAEARSSEWERGDVGLIVGTYAEPGAHLVFDNLSVLKP